MSFRGYNRPNNEFWATAISQVKAKYPVQFLAEVLLLLFVIYLIIYP